VAEALEDANLAAVESDFSENMLDACNYDADLKRRIRLAHTSNEKLAALFSNGFVGAALHTVVLIHLSVRANMAFIAQSAIQAALKKPVELMVAPAEGVLGPIEV
jgi:phosphoribosyl 1,2-cyclic phosphodiesterase